MLASLTVKQFALIEHVHLELNAGTTVFTGETGAGKSMLVDALGAVFGTRASSDWVRHGADKAEVTAVWQGGDERVHALLEANDIDIEDDLILRRIITSDGRSRAYLNGVPVAVKTMQKLGAICLDLHGQHEHQSLMSESVQQSVIDVRLSAAGLQSTKEAFVAWKQLKGRLHALHSERGETEQQASWMREELLRLDVLEIEEGLADALQLEVDSGRHHAQILQAATEALMLLDEAEPNVRDLLARTGHAVAAVEDYHDGLRRCRELIDQMDALLGEATPELSHVKDQAFDEQGLRRAEERLMALHESMRRHDCDEAGLLAHMETWQQRLAALDTAGWDEASLTQALQSAADTYTRHADALHVERKACGDALSGLLRPFLDKLALAGMQVRFEVRAEQDESGWSESGWDKVSIQVMSNPGEPWRELSSVVSGGELSRLVLALKGCGALSNMPHVAVFDEVDTGIGGETAWCVGELLSAMGRERQVLVISHLPQVASCADHQVVISKADKDGRTVTGLVCVQADARQAEIARMLGGAGEQSLEHAGDMLKRGQAAVLS
ncbi:DNA repair protein RecN [Mariprofundus micogutta]|uniref:DNA repair protein RecN n=1 Tax=Mariprofundus micogutta TaxID=1921010 RepID=A0A1L8CKH3_9PROT|nr:DNA repair protein RecN [Mariprofundus micogutta]GAV19400.1 DNA repair protein RecN [Mariprofundus micogutta]